MIAKLLKMEGIQQRTKWTIPAILPAVTVMELILIYVAISHWGNKGF